jgi:cytoskeletal protein CcmA (bactofilin family)
MAIFSKKNKIELDQQVISTLISEGCLLDGNLKAPAYVRIEGQINGDVNIDEGLILGEKGLVKGNVVTKEMIVYGTVNGNLNVQSLEIRGTGRITGDIKTQVLQVEPGGSHNGKLSMSGSAPVNNNHSPKQEKQAKVVEAEAV